MKRIVIDPGHGGVDPGAVAGGHQEKDLALKISLIAADILAARDDVWCEVTRDADIAWGELSLEARCDFSDRHEADLFISVHCNAMPPGSKAHGFEVFHFRNSISGRSAASQIFAAMESGNLGIAGRSVKSAGFFVLRHTAAPAALVECGFMTDPSDLRVMASADGQQRLGKAIAAGALAAVGIK
jgi:N-acetylmuramoyl-L-alanine amidase